MIIIIIYLFIKNMKSSKLTFYKKTIKSFNKGLKSKDNLQYSKNNDF